MVPRFSLVYRDFSRCVFSVKLISTCNALCKPPLFLERVDGRPWSVWITSLRAHGWPPWEPRSVWTWVTLMGSPSITDRLPGVVAQRVHVAAGTYITDEHKARGRQRAGATQRGATTSVCASLCQSFVAEVSRGGGQVLDLN